jgi:5-deoxy-glucuronate isomerase
LKRLQTQAGDRPSADDNALEDSGEVLLPKGYHPVVACQGHDVYYLNLMAGPTRTWRFSNAREHEWMMGR